jgi:FkbM family methyltransferase
VPIQVRNHIKGIIRKRRLGSLVLEKLDQENFFAQRSMIFNISGFEMLMPERHHLKSIMEKEPLRANLLAQASKTLLQHVEDVYVDVGANIGDTAAVVYANATEVPNSILIEPSDFFFSFLKKNHEVLPNSILMQNFVAHEYPIQTLIGTLHHWGGTAKFIESNEFGFEQPIRQIDLAQLINEKVKLVKIDCDGMDFRILKSVIPRLKRNSPAFYYENEITSISQLRDSLEVIELFEQEGYKYVIVARNCGTLIFGGEIGDNLRDVLQLQFALHAQGMRSAIHYTDILVFHSKQELEYRETLALLRGSQESLMLHKLGSR